MVLCYRKWEFSDSESGSAHISMDDLLRSKKDIKPLEPIKPLPEFEPCEWESDSDTTDSREFTLNHMTEREISELVISSLSTLQEIMEGNVYSERHDLFHSGPVNRRRLSSNGGPISETKAQHVAGILMDTFVSSKQTCWDYVLKVLLPETLVLLLATTEEE